MSNFLSRLFGFDAEKHNVRTEIVAGITTFLTMAYILAVNPSIFSALDMPKGAVFTATALAALIGTLVMAFYAKKPFALAPGMGLNACAGKFKKISPTMWVLAVLFICKYIFI